MVVFAKASLEALRHKIDLVDVVSSYVDLKRAGAIFKGLCPFHEEKTPSFCIQNGDTHYHCFGCGAHGDAIQFLMLQGRLSFFEAVEHLAERFHVHLERIEGGSSEEKVNKGEIKRALGEACRFFEWALLHTEEGHLAMQYLYQRGFNEAFIRKFRIGWALSQPEVFLKVLESKHVSPKILQEAGLVYRKEGSSLRPFFSQRITLPILDPTGHVIGFSARKIADHVFGGKYINTPETPVFKKSNVLFGLFFSRKKIAKERKVMIVEGQFDALSLIDAGFDYTVAGQGTAFGEGQVQKLVHLGAREVFLALDPDKAGREAAVKIGHFFQKEGLQVRVVLLPQGMDPDALLKQEGKEGWEIRLNQSIEYIPFVFHELAKEINSSTPAGKQAIVKKMSSQIRSWPHPVLVHESLRKLAHLAQVPEEMVGVGKDVVVPLYIKTKGTLSLFDVDPEKVLECDCLRWLWLQGEKVPKLYILAQKNLSQDAFRYPPCQKMYAILIDAYQQQKNLDHLTLASLLEHDQEILPVILEKKVNFDKSELHFKETLQKILDRNWLEARESLRRKIQSGTFNEEEVMKLAKQFDDLKKAQPVIVDE